MFGVVLWAIVGLVELAAKPYCRFYIVDDPSINYPNDADIVPFWVACLICVFVPLIGFILWTKLSPTSDKNKCFTHELHTALLTLFMALAVNQLFSSSFKVYAGRQRPNFIQRALQAGYTLQAMRANYAVVCESNNHQLLDGMKSFPSGHSSASFAAMTVLCLYSLGKAHANRQDYARGWKFGVCVLPYLIAFLIAISRTRDYHHNFSDIAAGAAIGCAAGMGAFAAYFHSPASKLSGEPLIRPSRYEELTPV
jgi:diacylglycerol diphosphate phosphatase/phosphatidate phosphatase